MAAVAQAQREPAGGGPMPGFGGMLEGDPVADARAHLPPEVADQAWREGLALPLERAVELARGGAPD
jgi:hypothetical protein